MDEKYEIEKYMIKQFWGIKDISQEFLDCFYRKEYRLINFKALIDENSIKNIDEIQVQEIKLKCKLIDELIRMLGFSNDAGTNKAVITNEQLQTNINQVLQQSLFFKDFDKHRLLFGLEKAKSTMFKKWTTKIFLNMINGIFERFGLVIKAQKKQIRFGKDRYYEITYLLLYEKNILEFIDHDKLSKKYNFFVKEGTKWNNFKNVILQ